ncbi:UNVERIFIED_CONTAM: hypothetical protein Sindi_2031000 [Sesamum indicum]
MVYGTEAIIPAELGVPFHRILHFFEKNNTKLLKENLDLIEELRERTFIRIQRYKNTMVNAHNRGVKTQSLQVGDFVLRRVDTLKPAGKLDPTWEGPFKVTVVIDEGLIRLKTLKDVHYHNLGTFTASRSIT